MRLIGQLLHKTIKRTKNKECVTFHPSGQQLCKFIGTKENVLVRQEFNSHRVGWNTTMAAVSIFLKHHYGRHDVM